ncbi:MAG: hypothetical protein SH856_05350 [Flavobacteriales bacterium]|nr:hypothetical protein [Flavobacteriales bacterium]
MKTLFTSICCIALVASFSVSAFASEPVPLSEMRPVQVGNDSDQELCTYLDLFLYDSYGDGWNGAILYVYDWNYNTVGSATFTTDYSYYTNFCLPGGCYYIFVSEGLYPDEIHWEAYEDLDTYLTGGDAGFSPYFTLGIPEYGCTNVSACNFNSYANCDDGSCCYGNCAILYMSDSFSDGWNGAYLTLVGNDGTWYINTTLADGGYGEVGVCVPDGCYQVVVSSGSFPSEISWTLHNALPGGGMVTAASGGAPFDQYTGLGGDCCYSGCANDDACNYEPFATTQNGECCYWNCATFVQNDSFGDGWNGATFSFTNWTGELIYEGKLGSGLTGIDKICLNDGCYEITVTGGYFPYEISWTYYDNENVISGGANQTEVFALGDIVSGCTEAAAANFNPLANCPDICLYTCDSDLDGNGVVNVGDLLIFTSEFGLVCN